jgi:hypothetical protein
MSRPGGGLEPVPSPAKDLPVPPNLRLAFGMKIKVDGERGTWKVMGLGRDGSLTVVGGPRKQWRSFRPEWCYPARSSARAGRVMAGRLPKELRGLRSQWRDAQRRGFSSAERASAPLEPRLWT